MFRPAHCSLYLLCSQERKRKKTHFFSSLSTATLIEGLVSLPSWKEGGSLCVGGSCPTELQARGEGSSSRLPEKGQEGPSSEQRECEFQCQIPPLTSV